MNLSRSGLFHGPSNRRNTKVPVEVYRNASVSGDISQLTPESIVQAYIYLYIQSRGASVEWMTSTYTDCDFQYVEQDPDTIADPELNFLDPFVFCYLTTCVPRKHTEGFAKYQGNKSKGLVRVADIYKKLVDDAAFIVPTNSLIALRTFLDQHTELFSDCVRTLISIASPAYATQEQKFASESLKSIEYCYMVGVMLIERYIVEPNHFVLAHVTVQSYMKEYTKWRDEAIKRYGSNWVFTAMIDREHWSRISKKYWFEMLWKVSGAFAVSVDPDMGLLQIGKTTVGAAMQEPNIRRITNMFKDASEEVLGHSATHTEASQEKLQNQFSLWTGGSGASGASAANTE